MFVRDKHNYYAGQLKYLAGTLNESHDLFLVYFHIPRNYQNCVHLIHIKFSSIQIFI